ncbi:MAG TPA: alpha/beta hydrolase [Anaerolineales bacterium]
MSSTETNVFYSDLEHSFVETNGLRLHTVQAGPADGPVALLLHGFPEFWWGWKKQIGPLAEAGYRVVAPDQRGYNTSDKPAGLSAYRLDVLANDAAGLIEALGRQKAYVVGHDWGGVVAWAAAVLHPERVDKLVVLNAPYLGVVSRTLPAHPEQLWRSRYMYFFQIPVLAEAMLRNNNWEPLVESMRRSSRAGAFSAEDFDQYRSAWWKKGAMTAMLNWYRALFRRPYSLPPAPRLQMPIMMLWGARDIALGRVLAEASIRLCENGQLIFFEDASHWVQHEEAVRVNELMLDFGKT